MAVVTGEGEKERALMNEFAAKFTLEGGTLDNALVEELEDHDNLRYRYRAIRGSDEASRTL